MKLETWPRCGSDFYRGLRVEWVGDRLRTLRQCVDCRHRYKSKPRIPGGPKMFDPRRQR